MYCRLDHKKSGILRLLLILVIYFCPFIYFSQHLSSKIDSFVAANPNFLPIIAAGNNGYAGEPAITSAGYSKNALVVGAVQVCLSLFNQQIFHDIYHRILLKDFCKRMLAQILNWSVGCNNFEQPLGRR